MKVGFWNVLEHPIGRGVSSDVKAYESVVGFLPFGVDTLWREASSPVEGFGHVLGDL